METLVSSAEHSPSHDEARDRSGLSYQAVFDGMRSAFALVDISRDEAGAPAGLICLAVNRVFEEQMGLRAESVVGRRAAEVLPGADESALVRACVEAASDRRPVQVELYLPSLGRHYSVSVFPTQPGQCGAAFADVTERVREHFVLQRYQLLFQHARDIMLFISYPDGRIVEANLAATRAYGYSQGELLSLTIQDLRAPETQALTRSQIERASSEGILFETVHRRKDGSLFPVEVSSLRADIGGEPVLLSIIREIAERKQAERQREEFVNLAAHEMRTPLTIFKGYLQILLNEGSHSERERHHFEVLKAQVNRLARLVQTLIATIQVESDEPAPALCLVDLAELVQQTVEAVSDTTQGVHLRVSCEGPASVEVDREQIREVLIHLLDNAVRYSPPDGTVEVALKLAVAEAIVSVRDRGPGIPLERQAHLFEAYYQISPMTRPNAGMGLGLYIARGILLRQGGRIWVESEVGAGSTFSFALPLA
jgi:PAS domain S-box-containing protein